MIVLSLYLIAQMIYNYSEMRFVSLEGLQESWSLVHLIKTLIQKKFSPSKTRCIITKSENFNFGGGCS